MSRSSLISQCRAIVGARYVLTGERATAPYRKGFREGNGPALAVIKPKDLWQQWQILEACIKAKVIIIMQAANTGLTGGSTPTEGCDREAIIINTARITDIHVLEEQEQILAFPSSSLYSLEQKLKPYGRVPHSVIGSSCIGASIVGGVCNNSGGALVERGPAYTELALYAQVNNKGDLVLVNHLDIALGITPKEILTRLQSRDYQKKDIQTSKKLASDKEYAKWVRETSNDTPARFNADPRRLFQVSGCAGKLAVFAVRIDTFIKNEEEMTFYLGTNSAETLQQIRMTILAQYSSLPVSAEYLHRDIISLTDNYGRDTVLLIKSIGTHWLPNFFSLKQKLDAVCQRLRFLPFSFVDKCIHYIARLFPSQIPKRLSEWNKAFEHQLILTVKQSQSKETNKLLSTMQKKSDLRFLKCTKSEAKSIYLLRFSAAGAAIQYAAVNHKEVESIVALDIALKRNEKNWVEDIPEEISSKLVHKFYYGHFLCHVFHQDYLVRKGEDAQAVKKALLALLKARGAEYPAEHNVGHHYDANVTLSSHYRQLDPTNTLNAGIGGMSKKHHYQK
ncbi:D-lactate dehydrogenase [Shewanella surugensis]|uniref:D-lactate dehydrogenase n=1 Tax=Shewanella surugensis TaxID=212020 RepID=A0ABT0L7T8_9GAMM|nr:D-lactate dehydrogenase [Shewanella surugensis]MCL1123731.1 D-lactate dehydrogenase [Shewanella surugensis]